MRSAKERRNPMFWQKKIMAGLALGFYTFAPAAAAAPLPPVPLGPEVGLDTRADVSCPVLAADPDQRFAVAWSEVQYRDGTASGRIRLAVGRKSVSPVSDWSTPVAAGSPTVEDVAMDSAGSAVLAWAKGPVHHIQRFDSTGQPSGPATILRLDGVVAVTAQDRVVAVSRITAGIAVQVLNLRGQAVSARTELALPAGAAVRVVKAPAGSFALILTAGDTFVARFQGNGVLLGSPRLLSRAPVDAGSSLALAAVLDDDGHLTFASQVSRRRQTTTQPVTVRTIDVHGRTVFAGSFAKGAGILESLSLDQSGTLLILFTDSSRVSTGALLRTDGAGGLSDAFPLSSPDSDDFLTGCPTGASAGAAWIISWVAGNFHQPGGILLREFSK
jgi:hypothetical protein